MYKLRIAKQVRGQIKKFPKIYQEAVVLALQDIKDSPLVGKPLSRELEGRFVYKVGPYRIIYKVNLGEKLVKIITAGHRSTIYN